MMAVLFVLVLGLVMVGLGLPLVRRLDSGGVLDQGEQVAAAFLLGAIVLYFAVFTVGPFRLDFLSMSAVLGVAAIAAVPGLRRLPWRTWWSDLTRLLVARRPIDGLSAALWTAVLLTALSALLQGMAPPNDYDSLLYHLSIPQLDLERGRIMPAWDRGLVHPFFPELTGHLVRLVLATAGEPAVQMVTALFGFVAAASAAFLVRRMGGGPRIGLAAALMVLACRMVVWEMATPEVEVALTAFGGLALVVTLAWRDQGGTRLMILAGLLMGGGLLVKFHGGVMALAIGMPIVWGLVRAPARIGQVVAGAAFGIGLFVPHMVHTAMLTGNPVFPLLNNVFQPGGVEYFANLRAQYGIGRGLLDLLVTPWVFSVAPMQHYDGMVLGAPYLVALAPLAVAARPRRGWAVLAVVLTYYVIWFYLLSQQVRFLMPIVPMLAAFAALGAAVLIRETAGAWRWAALLLLAVLALNQSLFVGIYAALRLPPALGLMSAADYHAKSPTLGGAFYTPCMWLRQHMAPGDRLLSLARPHSYYCPQAAAQLSLFPGEEKSWLRTGTPPPLDRAEFLDKFRAANFRWVMISRGLEHRRTDSGAPEMRSVDVTGDRLGVHLKDVLATLTPVAGDAFVAIYDGRAVLEALGDD